MKEWGAVSRGKQTNALLPLLMDPVNPYNNLLNLKKAEHLGDLFEVFEYAAGSVLKMIGNGCSDIDLIFCPQPLL